MSDFDQFMRENLADMIAVERKRAEKAEAELRKFDMSDDKLKDAVERLDVYGRDVDAITRAEIASLQSDIRLVLAALQEAQAEEVEGSK